GNLCDQPPPAQLDRGDGQPPIADVVGEVDFPALWASLKEAGLIVGETPWPALTEAQIAEQIAAIGAAQGVGFKPYEGPKGTAPRDAD
ncbi:MAG: hypothetical protein LH650_01695, partial [Chloroflexi bacterium]|nr:hypothetical protein [Chloroflexota bacterium]